MRELGKRLCRVDGNLCGVNGPITMPIGEQQIAEMCGFEWRGVMPADWTNSITKNTMDRLFEGKAVEVYGVNGRAVFQPLAAGEDGTKIPRSARAVYDCNGKLLRHTVTNAS